MQCPNCGQKNLESHRTTVPFNDIPGTILENVGVYDCPNCGARHRSYQRYPEFFDVLARAVIDHPARLNGARIRFLRKYLDITQVRLGQLLVVQPETVSRWENDAQDMSATADRLLRMLVAEHLDSADLGARLDQVAVRPSEAWALRIRFSEDAGWERVEADSSSEAVVR